MHCKSCSQTGYMIWNSCHPWVGSLSFSCSSANEMGRKTFPFFFCCLFPTPVENNQGRTSEHLHPFHIAVFLCYEVQKEGVKIKLTFWKKKEKVIYWTTWCNTSRIVKAIRECLWKLWYEIVTLAWIASPDNRMLLMAPFQKYHFGFMLSLCFWT